MLCHAEGPYNQTAAPARLLLAWGLQPHAAMSLDQGLSEQVCLQEKQAAVDRLRAELTELTQDAQAVTMVSETEATLQGRLQLAQVHLQACCSAYEACCWLA